MKKLFALMLALCLMLGGALAEEDTIQGEMFAMDTIGLQIFIPAEYAVDENAATEDGSQLLYAWKATDDSGEFLKVAAMKIEGVEDLNGLLEFAQANISADAEIVELESGLNVVMFFNDNDGTVNAALMDTNANIIYFDMGPTEGQKEAAAAAFMVLLQTLSPLQ